MPGTAAAGEPVLRRLDPKRWPLPLELLPAGSALVGGAVRDALLGRLQQRPDLDLVVPAGALVLCHSLARRLGGSAVVLDQARDIGRLVIQGWTIDLAACDGGSLEADLRRRDYSINAIALPLQADPVLLDPTGGLQDLQQGQLRAISRANLQSDPLRLLRGLRLAAELEFTLEAQTRRWIAELKGDLGAVASERVLAELDKLACCDAGAAGLLEVQQLGLLLPWLSTAITLQTPLQALTPNHAEAIGLLPGEWGWALPLARLACLADAAALERLRSSRALQERVRRLRQGWQLLAQCPWAELGEPQRFDLHSSLEADLPALLLMVPPSGDHAQLLQRWRDPADPLCHPRPPLDGNRLQQVLQRGPGPWLGRLLRHLSQERAWGRLAADASEATVLEAARQWLDTTAAADGTPRRD